METYFSYKLILATVIFVRDFTDSDIEACLSVKLILAYRSQSAA